MGRNILPFLGDHSNSNNNNNNNNNKRATTTTVHHTFLIQGRKKTIKKDGKLDVSANKVLSTLYLTGHLLSLYKIQIFIFLVISTFPYQCKNG